MKKLILSIGMLLLISTITLFDQSKFEQDRAAILAIGGFYKVTFDYAETFSLRGMTGFDINFEAFKQNTLWPGSKTILRQSYPDFYPPHPYPSTYF